MRRILSILVLVLLLAPLALPLALAGTAPALPACCRAAGAHHCSGTAALSLPGDGFRDAGRHCPYAHARLLPNAPRAQTPAAVPAPRAAQPARVESSLVRPAAPAARSQSSRAPPTLSSL